VKNGEGVAELRGTPPIPPLFLSAMINKLLLLVITGRMNKDDLPFPSR
jgi:hypothetical protein